MNPIFELAKTYITLNDQKSKLDDSEPTFTRPVVSSDYDIILAKFKADQYISALDSWKNSKELLCKELNVVKASLHASLVELGFSIDIIVDGFHYRLRPTIWCGEKRISSDKWKRA